MTAEPGLYEELTSPLLDGFEPGDLESDESEWEVGEEEFGFEPELLMEAGSVEELGLGEVPGEPDWEQEQVGILSSFNDLVRQGMASAAVLTALAGGERDEGKLTNKVFFARHPELGGRALRPEDRALAVEWLQIRDRLVRPLLARGRGSPAAASFARQRMSTQQLRNAWAAYAGRHNLMDEARVQGHRVQVNPRIVEAVVRLGHALEAAGYRADTIGGFCNRKIKTKVDGRVQETDRWSLHSYGIALDIDPKHNPHRHGRTGPARWPTAPTLDGRRAEVAADRADTSFTPQQITAAATIRTVDGLPVFYWAGGWRTSPDAMHFQIDVTPDELARGLASTGVAASPEHEVVEESFLPFDAIRSILRKPTVGFEFDVHYGIQRALLSSSVTVPGKDAAVSNHTWAADGFKVKLDGARLEINTRPFEVTASGRAELGQAAVAVRMFADELFEGCRQAKPSTVKVPKVDGAPRPFKHPRITVFPIMKLPVNREFTNCSVWASPQATLTIRLAKVSALVDRIRTSQDKGPGLALTGGPTARMGMRSDALFHAQDEVRKARRASTFSDDLEGFLILLASYLWTSELPYRFPAPDKDARPGEDYERFGKAYLPINVKTPFSQVFASLLSPPDQQVFKDRFAVGGARTALFGLARPSGATLADGARKFLPPGREEHGQATVHMWQEREFRRVPTWDDIVDHTLDSTHQGWKHRLMVPLSNPIDVDRTNPRVALELRRIGFVALDRSRWEGLMGQVFDLTDELNR